MPITSTRLSTPLGDLEFVAEVDGVPSALSGTLDVARMDPSLPDGMSVGDCYVVLLRVPAVEVSTSVRFAARLHPVAPVTAGAATGQGLEAQSWQNGQYKLLVGTEDVERLSGRFPAWASLPQDPFAYSPASLAFYFPNVPPNQSLSLHFVAAWSSFPEPSDASCWYAVYQLHNAVIAAVGG
jgi:hypothetical protein